MFVTGNTVIDALKTTVVKDYHFTTDLLNHLDYTGRKIILVTATGGRTTASPWLTS